MSLWLSYRNISGDEGPGGCDCDLRDFQYVKAGALINF